MVCNWKILVMLLFRVIKRLFWGKSLDSKTCKKYVCFLKKIEDKSSKVQIIECDKIYHHILRDLWYSWSFWEILKRNPKEIKNIQDVWRLHKLRNSLVHELKERDEKFLEKSAEEYRWIVKDFLKYVTQK